MGRSEPEAAKVLIDYFKLPITPDEYTQQNEAGYIKHFPECVLLPGESLLCNIDYVILIVVQ